MTFRLGLIASVAGLGLLASVGSGQAQDFGYACETCPANWGNLPGPNFAQCRDGEAQSPIAFDTGTAKRRRLAPLDPDFGEAVVKAELTGTNVEFAVEEGDPVTDVGDARFDLLQFHFHSTSEHVVNGERTPLEMHLVHRQGDDGPIAVIAVFIREGDELEALEALTDALPDVEEGDEFEIDLDDLLPRSLRSFRYTGSTTTPPCTPDVSWIILDRTIEMSAEQIEAIQDTIRGFNPLLTAGGDEFLFDNNRPIQNLNGRAILTDVRRDDDDEDDDENDD